MVNSEPEYRAADIEAKTLTEFYAKPESTDGRREGQASWDEGVAGEAAWAPWGRM